VHGIRRKRDGYAVGLRLPERRLLRESAEGLEALLLGGEAPPRLFPAAYRDDEEAADEYDRLVRPALEEGKLAAVRTLVQTADDTRIDEETAQTWLRALNDLRLVLGTRLDVREDDGLSRLREPGYAVYAWLTWLQSELIEALTSG
jgi:Domain of unknown function (DUF2017)